MISCHHFRKNVTQKSDDLTISTGILTLVTVDDTPFLNLYPQTNQTLEIIREQSTIPTDSNLFNSTRFYRELGDFALSDRGWKETVFDSQS